MRLHQLALAVFCAVTTFGAITPAFANDDWRWHERQEWREHAWRQHEWREHGWREHFAPRTLSVRPYGYYAPPPVFYHNPAY
jgi:hypothetical protein